MSHYQEFLDRFRNMTNDELVKAFEEDKGKRVGINAHLEFIRALREEFERRGLEYPSTP